MTNLRNLVVWTAGIGLMVACAEPSEVEDVDLEDSASTEDSTTARRVAYDKDREANSLDVGEDVSRKTTESIMPDGDDPEAPADDPADDGGMENKDEPPPKEDPPPQEDPALSLSDINKAIRDYARNKLGQQVGNGLCQALQTGALAAVSGQLGANTATLTGSSFSLDKRRFALMAADDKVLPGDILHWEGGTNYNNYPPGGDIDQFDPVNPDHLAFVAVAEGHVTIVETVTTVEVDGRDVTEIEVLHQNINNVKKVQRHTLWLDPMMISTGSIKIYRPEPMP